MVRKVEANDQERKGGEAEGEEEEGARSREKDRVELLCDALLVEEVGTARSACHL